MLLLSGCGSRSMQDHLEEGEHLTLELIEELEVIRSREELIVAAPRLKQLFDQLVDTMIAAKEFREKHPSAETPLLTDRNRSLSELLKTELNRIYKLDGGREIIEKCQLDALNRLDGYTKKKIAK